MSFGLECWLDKTSTDVILFATEVQNAFIYKQNSRLSVFILSFYFLFFLSNGLDFLYAFNFCVDAKKTCKKVRNIWPIGKFCFKSSSLFLVLNDPCTNNKFSGGSWCLLPFVVIRRTYCRKPALKAMSFSIRCEQSTKDGNSVDVWLGRLAMVGFAVAISVEIATGKGLLEVCCILYKWLFWFGSWYNF